MSETATTQGDSGENQATPGSSQTGTSTGSQPGADQFAQERQTLEARARSFQSESDRAKAELAELRKQLDAKNEGAGDQQKPSGMTADEMLAMLDRRDGLRAAADTLKTEFPSADPALFSNPMSYQSVEAFRAAVEDSHTRISTVVTAQAEAATAAVRQQYEAKFGPLGETPPDNGGATSTGLPALAEYAAMSFDQRDALEARVGKDALQTHLRSLMGGS